MGKRYSEMFHVNGHKWRGGRVDRAVEIWIIHIRNDDPEVKVI